MTDRDDAELLAWLLRLPAVKAQAYFWNYSSRTERKKAMRRDYITTRPASSAGALNTEEE